jgi:FixJ family two-component response regulator
MAAQAPLLAVVDDDADVRIALMRLAISAGYRTEGFATGAEFLLAHEYRAPDCVILDLHMPGLNGFDVQTALNARGSEVPVIAITGHDTAESKTRTRELGAHAYLPKPVDFEALLSAVESAVRSCGSR